jgi:excinuclease ABC subunit C
LEYEILRAKKEKLDEYLGNLERLQIVSIAKREEELFKPYAKESILLSKDSQELRMTQKIRDEAHRFAITFNRDKRIKAMKKNILEELP